MKRETISLALNELSERHVSDTVVFSPGTMQDSEERTVYMKKKRIITFVLAAALILALGIAAFAISGIPRYTGTHVMPQAAEYTSLSELPMIEKNVGYPVTVPESFSNGYTFTGLRVDGQAVYGESYEVLEEYYVVNVTYSKAGSPDLRLHISPVLEIESSSEAPEPSEKRTVNGTDVNLNRDHYKVVPEDYEKTEDDLAREAAGHYYISFGSDEIEEYEMAFADFRQDSTIYTLMDMAADDNSPDTLIQMASEIIDAAKS